MPEKKKLRMWMVLSPSLQTQIHNTITTQTYQHHHLQFKPKTTRITFPYKPKCQHQQQKQPKSQEDFIPFKDVKTLAKFKSRHNYIRVLEVSRKADHPFRGSRLLLLDNPGNIHSISFLFKTLTDTYFDVFATLPPIIPPGPIAVLGFGAGSTASIILKFYPNAVVHGWELDTSVIDVAREFFNLDKIERENKNRLFVYVGNALTASLVGGFSGIIVDLFSKGSLIPELQETATWEKLRKSLRKGGRIMVNVGGSCVEAEDKGRDGNLVMEETLKTMKMVFGEKLFVLRLGNRGEDSSLALTGDFPDIDSWKNALPNSLRCYVDLWRPYSG